MIELLLQQGPSRVPPAFALGLAVVIATIAIGYVIGFYWLLFGDRVLALLGKTDST